MSFFEVPMLREMANLGFKFIPAMQNKSTSVFGSCSKHPSGHFFTARYLKVRTLAEAQARANIPPGSQGDPSKSDFKPPPFTYFSICWLSAGDINKMDSSCQGVDRLPAPQRRAVHSQALIWGYLRSTSRPSAPSAKALRSKRHAA